LSAGTPSGCIATPGHLARKQRFGNPREKLLQVEEWQAQRVPVSWALGHPTDGHKRVQQLSPRMHGHINMLGHYTFTLPEDILKGELKALNFNTNSELSS